MPDQNDDSQFNLDDLSQFIGSESFYRHSFNRSVIYTEGVQYVAEKAKANWLIDAIASHIGSSEFNKAARRDDRITLLHFWDLAVNEDDRSAVLSAKVDSGEKPFVTQDILYTDFPAKEIAIWARDNGQGFTLMLPSEY